MKPHIAILATLSANGEQGGAERFFEGLRNALEIAGVSAEVLETYSNEDNFEQIRKSYLRFYDLDLREYDGVISAKAPSYVARHRNHVCYLMHTIRVFYDMFETTFPHPSREILEQRRLVHAIDTAAFQRTKRLFAIGEEVSARLNKYNGLDASVMRHPTSLQGLHEGAFNYFLMPGRLHRWKRPHLAIEAMRFVRGPVELIITGTGEEETQARSLADADPRIRFLGRVADESLAALYAHALAVIFTPLREDLGLVTLEAFHSAKPVITCSDSGEPARIVADGTSGYVCPPEPAEIGARMNLLASNEAMAREMGHKGREAIAEITWGGIAARLCEALNVR